MNTVQHVLRRKTECKETKPHRQIRTSTRYHKFTDLPACSEPKERDCTIPGTRKASALGARQASAHCAAALQRRPMQTPQQKTLRRALQGDPEACDHSEIAGRNRPGLPPEASWLPRSGTIVGPHRRTATPTRPAPPRPGPKIRQEGRRVDTNNARGGITRHRHSGDPALPPPHTGIQLSLFGRCLSAGIHRCFQGSSGTGFLKGSPRGSPNTPFSTGIQRCLSGIQERHRGSRGTLSPLYWVTERTT